MRITLRAARAAHTLAAAYGHSWGDVISPADIEGLADHNGLVDPDEIRALARERIGNDPLPGIIGPELDEAGQVVHTTATGRLNWVISPEEITFLIYRPTGEAVLWARLSLADYELLGADGYGVAYRRHLDALLAAVGALNPDAARRVEKDLFPCIDPHDRVWQVIEDNAGGLHLAVFEGDAVIFYGSGYEHNEDGLRADLEALRNGADPRSDAWEMPVDDPQAAYDELTSHEHGWKIVADQEGIYYDRMGAAATSAFAIPWQDLKLFNSDNQDVTDADEIRQALAEFRERESISGYFFHRIGAPHEDPEDASTWGPQSPDHVDWTGFDEALEEAYGRG